MRVLLAAHGTRGDVQPVLALAHALRARGHAAAFVAPSNFVAWIRAQGFDAESNGIDAEAVLTEPGADLQSLRWQVRISQSSSIVCSRRSPPRPSTPTSSSAPAFR